MNIAQPTNMILARMRPHLLEFTTTAQRVI